MEQSGPGQVEIVTLLDKATEDDGGVYVLCPRTKLEDLAAEIIIEKLTQLNAIRALLRSHEGRDEWDDVGALREINDIVFPGGSR